MIRRKEIEQAAFNYINSDAVSAENMQLAFGDFINGAEWADKTMMTHEEEFEEFKELVMRMRDAQKQWKDGDPFDGAEMELAKRMQEAEREVDEYLKKMEV